MSANESKSSRSGSHGTELAAPVSEASEAIARAPPLENGCDLERRDASAAPVRQPQVRLAERRRVRGFADIEIPVSLEKAEHDPERILDVHTVP